MSSKEFEISDHQTWEGETWWELRPKMIQMPVKSWAAIKSFIIKICKKSNKCSGSSITNWERTVNTIDQKIAGEKE
tara:strand:- start:21813 stop:22040 length:228 start_codon:yes stop_codon:yes gene_type:complete